MTQDEIIGALRKPFFAPRPRPTPIPDAHWDDAPLFCLQVNDEWASHILGVMEALDQQDTWIGSSAEVLDARQQVLQIMKALMTMCEDCAMEFQLVDCDLQYRNSPEDEWISLGNVCGADGADGTNGTDGTDGVDGTNGTNGTDGADGADGADGIDGTDCDCEEFNHVPTPTNPEGADDNQTSCNIAAGISEYLRDKEIFALSQANTAVGITTAIMGVVASIIAAVVTGGLAAPAIIAAVTVFINVLLAADGGERDAQIADDSFWNSLSCCIYCALKPNKDFDAALQIAIGTAIRNCDYTSGSYDAPFWYDVLASLWEALPIEVIRNNVAVGALINYDCSGCDCPEELCDLDLWAVTTGFGDIFGNIVSRNPATGEIVVETTGINTNSRYYIDINLNQNNDSALGCVVVSIVGAIGWVWQEPPAAFSTGAFTSGLVAGHCVNHLQTSDTAPFTVTITLGVC